MFGVFFSVLVLPLSNFVGLIAALLCALLCVIVLPTQREAVKFNQLTLCKSV